MIRFSCPGCKTVLEVAVATPGAVMACPRCKTKLKLPSAPSLPQAIPIAPPAAVHSAPPARIPALEPAPSLPPAPASLSPQMERLVMFVLGGLLIVFFLAVFCFAPDRLPEFKQRMLAISCGLLAGGFAFFLTGQLNLEIKAIKTLFGDMGVKASGGVAVFLFVLLWWFSPLAPVGVDKKLDDIKQDTAAIKQDTTGIKEDTREIKTGLKEGMAGLGRLGGLKSNPETAIDYYHNALVYLKDGDTKNTRLAFEKYFDKETTEFYDPYLEYWDVLRKVFNPEETGEMLRHLAERKPKSLALQLVLLQQGAGRGQAERYREFLKEHADYLPAYRLLVNSLPAGTLLEERQQSLVRVEFEERGGYEKLKEFYLNPAHDHLKFFRTFGLKAPLDMSKYLLVNVQGDDLFRALVVGIDDKRPGQKVILTFGNGAVAEVPILPLRDNEPETVAAVMELRSGKGSEPKYEKRRANDIRIFKFSGYLSGIKPSAIRFNLEYVDAKGNHYKFPDPVGTVVSFFRAEVASGRKVMEFGRVREPQLWIYPQELLKSCQVALSKDGPFVRVPTHMNVPTIHELALKKVPGFDGKPGPHLFWIKGVTDAGQSVGPETIQVECPESD